MIIEGEYLLISHLTLLHSEWPKLQSFGPSEDNRVKLYVVIPHLNWLTETERIQMRSPSSEPSHSDVSDEGSQYMFLCRINKNYP